MVRSARQRNAVSPGLDGAVLLIDAAVQPGIFVATLLRRDHGAEGGVRAWHAEAAAAEAVEALAQPLGDAGVVTLAVGASLACGGRVETAGFGTDWLRRLPGGDRVARMRGRDDELRYAFEAALPMPVDRLAVDALEPPARSAEAWAFAFGVDREAAAAFLAALAASGCRVRSVEPFAWLVARGWRESTRHAGAGRRLIIGRDSPALAEHHRLTGRHEIDLLRLDPEHDLPADWSVIELGQAGFTPRTRVHLARALRAAPAEAGASDAPSVAGTGTGAATGTVAGWGGVSLSAASREALGGAGLAFDGIALDAGRLACAAATGPVTLDLRRGAAEFDGAGGMWEGLDADAGAAERAEHVLGRVGRFPGVRVLAVGLAVGLLAIAAVAGVLRARYTAEADTFAAGMAAVYRQAAKDPDATIPAGSRVPDLLQGVLLDLGGGGAGSGAGASSGDAGSVVRAVVRAVAEMRGVGLSAEDAAESDTEGDPDAGASSGVTDVLSPGLVVRQISFAPSGITLSGRIDSYAASERFAAVLSESLGLPFLVQGVSREPDGLYSFDIVARPEGV